MSQPTETAQGAKPAHPARWMLGGLQGRIIFFITGLLVVVLGSVLLVVNAVNSRNAHATIDENLAVGERVFRRLLEQNGRQMAQTADILSLDFAFRQAVATGDRQTTESALANEGARVGADLVTLVGLDHKVIADSMERSLSGRPFRFAALLQKAEHDGRAAGLAVYKNEAYQLVVVPVLAPQPVAWAVFGFLLRGRLDRDVQTLTGLNLSLYGRSFGESSWQVLASTLPPDLQETARTAIFRAATPDAPTVEVAGTNNNYQLKVIPLGQDGGGFEIVAVLAQSVADALKPFQRLAASLIALGLGALVLSVIGGALVARGITRPIRMLADMSQRIEEGDFAHEVNIERDDEIGELASRFNRMREGLAAREEQILRLAYRDMLTDLPNRTLFNDRLHVALEQAKRSNAPLAVLLMDLDRFKQINDTLGHQTGDMVLQQFSHRLRELLRKSDTVARLGGDEFTVLLSDTGPSEAAAIAAKIVAGLEEPIVLSGHSLDVRTSIGIANFPADGRDADILMRRADTAMYAAKRAKARLCLLRAGAGSLPPRAPVAAHRSAPRHRDGRTAAGVPAQGAPGLGRGGGRRGTGALGAPRPRTHPARQLHSLRRADRLHPPHHALGDRGRRQAGRGVERRWHAPQDRREHFGPGPARSHHAGNGAVGAGHLQDPHAPDRPGNHRKRRHAGPRRRHRRVAPAARPGHRPRHRRLRHRLLLARLCQAVHGHRAENRPLLHPQHRVRHQGPRHRALHHRARPQPRPHGGGRRRGGPGIGAGADRAGLRPHPGLRLFQAHRGPRIPGLGGRASSQSRRRGGLGRVTLLS
jgi:diguanylate cyclase (GGDEF)-like protein